ncbi:MAG: 16S rRNA (cytosine(967)-C(5))-methyltransferase RsmB [Candidatus Binatus sp.]|uniref:16S rRNA (cytosine(967)-C(5))-methyltransferase RsmB n=1 Tax=Candidatus Binatus sp. TaxID=2811406 RepID=UPI00271E76F2|nr:16S rRNA (cytosine(967)-C(5))-methyltransferase RsmB [Candidatus Binatus sp.]MDO8433574.1 16S rRNA (cytosine(967)-C(5))-methyltransferase RsmB [Candidatus Binatus sp.]
MSERPASSIRRASPAARAANEGIASRLAAVEILLRVDEQNGYADVLLGARLPEFKLSDRRLITRLVLGTIAWRARIDYELALLTGRRLDGIQPPVLAIMRMGLFQLRFLDRVPQHAVVDTAVSLAKRIPEARKASGFVNAVMRRATREQPALPNRARDENRFLAIAYSHPRWMVERFVASFGAADAERLMAANNEAAPNAIRLNLKRGTRDEIIARLIEEGFEIGDGGRAPETIVLNGAANFESSAYRDGLFHAQSEASQMVARMLAPPIGATVVDCAAAPGGKSSHLAEMVGERGRVIALDLNFAGLKNARDVANRLRHDNISFVRADLASAIPLPPMRFDYVLLDAPCTGLGTLREHPEIRWRVGPQDPARMAAIQLRMLEHASSIVRSGGAVVYSVCSIAPEEGIGVIDSFLQHHREFDIDRELEHREEFEGVLDARGLMQTRPDIGGLDGFFAARLKRR